MGAIGVSGQAIICAEQCGEVFEGPRTEAEKAGWVLLVLNPDVWLCPDCEEDW